MHIVIWYLWNMCSKGGLAMKKEYIAPEIELVKYSICEAIAEDELIFSPSDPYNDGELGWT